MKLWILASLCTVSVVVGAVARASPVTFKASKYGTFEHRNKGDDCEVWFRSSAGATTKVLGASFCADDKMVTLEETTSFGGVTFPAVASSGEEFHFLAIPSARGGNASVACDYYGVVVTATKAWASPMFQIRNCDPSLAPLESMKIVEEKGGAWLSFREPATTTSAGTAYELRLGQLKVTAIPKKARSGVSTTNVARSGTLSGPYHYTNWKHIIRDGSTEHVIDEPGSCALDRLADTSVEMTGRLKTWSDGATELTCTAIKARK